MSPEATPPSIDQKDRWGSHASIAVLLRYGFQGRGLILVQIDKEWGLPAGGLKQKEYPLNGLRREILEETGIGPDKIIFRNSNLTGWEYTPREHIYIMPVLNITVPGEDKTSVGQIFSAEYVGPKLPKKGWAVQGDVKVGFCKPFNLRDLLELLEEHYDEGQVIYRPGFNAIAIVHHILFSSSTNGFIGMYSNYPPHVNKTLEKIWFRSNFLKLVHTETPFNENYWMLDHPSLGGTQNSTAIARQDGRKWGP